MAGVVISGDGFNPSRTYGNLGVEQIWFDPEVTANARTGVLNCHRAYVRWVPKTAASDNFPGTADSRVRVHVHNASDATGGAEQYSPAYARPNPTTAAAQWLLYWTLQPNDTGALPATHGAYVIYDLSGATWGRLVGGHDFTGPDATWPGSSYGYYIRAHTTTAGRLPPGLSAVDLAPFDGVHYPEGVGFADGCTAGAGQPEGDFGSDKPYSFGFQANQARSPDPVNLATGVFTTQAEDLALPGRVLSLGFTRTYNSADQTTGPLGPAWTHSYSWRLTDSGSSVEVRRGDGRRDTYTRNADGSYANPPDTFDVLAKNADGSFTLTLTNQVAYEFSSGGALTRIREPAGNQITLTYAAGNLTTITDTVGRQVTLSYDAANRLTQLQDPLGRKVTSTYDASGRLATVTDKLGNAAGQDPTRHQWRYAYDGTTQHLTTITDPDGRVRVTNAYDAQGRVFEQRDGLGSLTTFAYSAGQTVLTDPRGTQTTYTFDSRMRVLTESTVVGGLTRTLSYTYDAQGNRTSVTDRNAKRTDFTYDSRGNVLQKTDPSPDGVAPRAVTQFAYDSRNNLTQITDAAGFTTMISYDPATNVLLSVARQIDATTSAATKYEYADAANPGLPTRIIAPRGNTGPSPDYTFATTLAYDVQANLASRTDPDGARTTFSYDADGRLVSFVDPDGNATGGIPAEHTWTISYDENDRETSRADPLGNTLRFAHDGAGNRTSLTDRRGNVTTYAYDANTRLASVQQKPDPVGNPTLVYTTQVTRDANGSATRITQANGVATDYAYDALNRLVSVTTHPDAQTNLTTGYTLDGNGQPTSRTTADGVTVSYVYDALSRLTSVSATGLSITYAYDALGRRTQMMDGTGTTTYQYDGLGRLTQVAAPNGTLTYAYDRDGNRTTLGYSATESVTYAYSPGGRMTTVTDWASRVSSYTYKPSGLVASLAYPNGMRASYSYDRAQRLTEVVNAISARTITRHTYTLDPEGNRTTLDEFVEGITRPPVDWGASTKVNDDVSSGRHQEPAVAIASDGVAYLTWEDARPTDTCTCKVFVSRRDPATGSWSANERVDDSDTGAKHAPSIGIDAGGTVYAVWDWSRTQNDRDIFSSKRSATTGQWSASTKVNDDKAGNFTQRRPRIAVRASGEALAVWEDWRSNENNLFSARLPAAGSTWSANMRVTDYPLGSKERVDVAFAPDGTAVAVWGDFRGGNWSIFSATLAPGATAWSPNVRVNDEPTVSEQRKPRIGIDGSGNILVVWLDDRTGSMQVRTTRRAAGATAWAASEPIPDAAPSRNCATLENEPCDLALSVRSDGVAYVAWQDSRDGFAWGSKYDPITNTWSPRQRVSDGRLGSTTAAGNRANGRVSVAMDNAGIIGAWEDARTDPANIRAARATLNPGVDRFSYSYDGLNRLLSVGGALSGGASADESFTLDGATNLTSRTGPTATYTIDGANRVTSDGTRSFVWDAADRLVTRAADTFAYDPLARLVSSTVSGVTRAYTYDGDGLLRSGTEGAVATSFLHDPSVTPAPLLQAGTERIVYGLGPLYRVQADGGFVGLARDAVGSVRAEVSGAGSLTNAYSYASYGAVRARLAGLPVLGFAGELTDPSGLIYLRTRWYDPASSRFLSRDLFPGVAAKPSSLNAYVYVGGNPVMLIDPLGTCPWCAAAAIGAAVGGIASVGGYAVSAWVTGSEFRIEQAAIAFATGAVSGAVCAATVMLVCGVANTTAAVVQYHLSPGEKSTGGYFLAAAVGVITTPLVHTPYWAPSGRVATTLARHAPILSENAWSIVGSFARSFLASVISSLAQEIASDAALAAQGAK